jgi:hypothetical protein
MQLCLCVKLLAVGTIAYALRHLLLHRWSVELANQTLVLRRL